MSYHIFWALTSPDFGHQGQISWSASYLRFLRRGGGRGGRVSIFEGKERQEGFVEKFLHYRECKSCVLHHLLQEYSFRLDQSSSPVDIWMQFYDSTDVFFPNHRPENHLLQFGSFMTYKIAQIMGAREDLRPATLSEQNYSLNIIRTENQNISCWLG